MMNILEFIDVTINKKRGISLKNISFQMKKQSILGLVEVDNELKHDLIHAIVGFNASYTGTIK